MRKAEILAALKADPDAQFALKPSSWRHDAYYEKVQGLSEHSAGV